MAIIYTYPLKTKPTSADLVLISDVADKNKTKSIKISTLPGGVDFISVEGSGTTGKIPKWSDPNTLTDSSIFEASATGNIGIGTTSPSHLLEVQGDTAIASINGLTTNGKPMLFIGEQNAYGIGFRWGSSLSLDIIDFDNVTPTSTSGTKIGHFETRNEEFYWKGNVGIGTTAPLEKLDVRGVLRVNPDFPGTSGTQTGIILKDPGAGNNEGLNIEFQSASDTNTAFIGSVSPDNLRFGTAGVERMRILGDGNVGIGETNPTGKFCVSRDSAPDYGYVCKLTSTSTAQQVKVLTIQSGYNSGGGTTVGDRMFVYSDGDLENINGSYGTIGSDERLKENIIDAKPKLNDILSLKVKNFNLIGNNKKHIGFIAQEFEKVFPSLVKSNDTRVYKTHDENGVLLEEQGELISGYEDSRSLRVGMEFAILTKAIQEQQEIIENLKQRIEQLEITK